jgi:hypothetical protein
VGLDALSGPWDLGYPSCYLGAGTWGPVGNPRGTDQSLDPPVHWWGTLEESCPGWVTGRAGPLGQGTWSQEHIAFSVVMGSPGVASWTSLQKFHRDNHLTGQNFLGLLSTMW